MARENKALGNEPSPERNQPLELPARSESIGPLDELVRQLRVSVRERREVCYVHHESARAARLAAVLPALHERLLRHLADEGPWPLWSHQSEVVTRALAGEHVVVSSATASGKTLCYNLPVLDAVLRGPNAYALYLFPTKALAQDQMRALLRLIEALGIEAEAGIYDGDTEPVMRRRLRKHGRIILTNPDMLHAAILPHHGGWAGLFSNLRYVVVDEMHTLRGIFGSHASNVIRRLRRIARHYGSNPTFIGASATIANPAEHAKRLFGLDATVVGDDGAPRGAKTFVLWNPPQVVRDDGTSFRKGAPSVAVRLLPELVRRDVKSICFGRSRNTVELILRYIRERAQSEKQYADVPARVEAYRGGYLPSERREIERRLFTGDLKGVVATNALELGIDIGDLECCLIAGWPGSVSSFRQQAGRAGRRSSDALVFLLAGQEPIDQYFMRHPEELFAQSPEHATIEPTNPYILVRQLLCASYELPLQRPDEEFFGTQLLGVLRLLVEDGRLRETAGRFYFPGREYPAAQVKLRSASDENFTIYELGSERIIGELDYVAAMLSLYPQAVYIHRTETHLVERMDPLNKIVHIRREETGYYTQALCQKQVTVREEWESNEGPGARRSLAEVDVVTHLTGFKKVRFHSLENIGYGRIELPPLELDTVALVIDLTAVAIKATDPYGPDFLRSGLHGLARLCREMLAIRAMCDPSDLDSFIEGARIYIYDLYPGGIGYSELGYERLPEVLAATLEAMVECPCAAGCPSCVLPSSTRVETYMEPSILEYPFPKEAARFLLHLLLDLEAYVPKLDGVPLPVSATPAPVESDLDERTERKVRKALRGLD
ncbi:MAG: DEAD/DEAH box helicase [Planctomycetota bacterium]